MPKVQYIFSKLNGVKYFSTLDLRAGYHQVPLDRSLIPKTAFNSPFGKYEYVKVHFGLAQLQHISRINYQNLKGPQLCNTIFR